MSYNDYVPWFAFQVFDYLHLIEYARDGNVIASGSRIVRLMPNNALDGTEDNHISCV